MFFFAKKLLSQKQKLAEQIKNENKTIETEYLRVANELSQFYSGYECFNSFEITEVDFWFGDLAYCYDGNNYDLSDAFFRMWKQLSDIKGEELNTKQLLGIYNILTVLFNDIYASEEPIVIQTDLSQHVVLDKFKILVDKLILSLNNEHSTAAVQLSKSIQMLYTFLDFSLYVSPKHQYLRQLKNQYLEIESAASTKISLYRSEIEKINLQLEKHNYSEEGKKISKKEFSPFPTLKAYNNAMKLFQCCLLTVEKYEKEGDVLSPSFLAHTLQRQA